LEFSEGLDVSNDVDLSDKEVVEDIPEAEVEPFNIMIVLFLQSQKHLFLKYLFGGLGELEHDVLVGIFIQGGEVTGFDDNGQKVLVEFKVEQLNLLVHNGILVLDLFGHEVDDFDVFNFVTHIFFDVVIDELHLLGHLDVVVITLLQGNEGIHGGVEHLFTNSRTGKVNQFLYLFREHVVLEHIV